VGRELQGGDKAQWHGVKHIQASWIVCGSASIVIGTNEEDMNESESKVAWHGKKDWGKAGHAAPTDTRLGWRWR
jgi:hypothetical protein